MGTDGFWNQTNHRTATHQKTRIQLWAAEHPLAFWALWGLGRGAKFLFWAAPASIARAVTAKAKATPAEDEAATVTAIGTARRTKGRA